METTYKLIYSINHLLIVSGNIKKCFLYILYFFKIILNICIYFINNSYIILYKKGVDPLNVKYNKLELF